MHVAGHVSGAKECQWNQVLSASNKISCFDCFDCAVALTSFCCTSGRAAAAADYSFGLLQDQDQVSAADQKSHD